MLEGRRNFEHVDDVTSGTRAELDELCSDGILERDGPIYRASHIALYSTFGAAEPPIFH